MNKDRIMEIWNAFTSLNITQQINVVALIIAGIFIILAIVETIRIKRYLKRVDACLTDHRTKVLRAVEKSRKEKE